MQQTYLRTLLMVVAIAFFVLGFTALFLPATTLLTFTIGLGVIMLVSGIITTITYILDRNEIKRSGWVLADGILSFILGILILINAFVGIIAVIFFLAMWLIFSGVLRISGSLQLKEWDVNQWGWMMALGILNIVIGAITMFYAMFGGVEFFLFLALPFMVLGLNGISMYVLFRNFEIKRTGRNNEQIEVKEREE